VSKDWIIQPPHPNVDHTARSWNVDAIIAQILLNRGIDRSDQAGAFLDPQLTGLHPPEALSGTDRASEIIAAAARAQKRIVIYGDYDVDGITATAILWRVLKLAGANVRYYVPHRVSEGYGLHAEAIASLAADGADLIISVDCGITSIEEARIARQRGVPLIITDHHQPRDTLPHAEAIVHPQVGGVYPNPHLCGAGVAFKLAWALARRFSGSDRVTDEYRLLLTEALPAAAIGTIADVVPLVGENRILARCGLARIRACRWPGMVALLDVAGLNDAAVNGEDVGFKLAPRINAAGRMGHARLAMDMMTTDDPARAREIALYLDDHNRKRQTMQRRLTRKVSELIERNGLDGDTGRAIVLADDGWHAGLIGVVASRIVDRYRKPTVLISLDNGTGQGSARSVPGFALHEALDACRDHLSSHGGHAMAAGLRIEREKVPGFTDAFVRVANNMLGGSALRHRILIDGEVTLETLDERTVSSICNLGPFGEGNARPILATHWVELASDPRCVGKNGEHLQLTMRENGTQMRGIAFQAAGHLEKLKEHRRCRVAFEPVINNFNNRRRAEMQVVDFKFPGEM